MFRRLSTAVMCLALALGLACGGGGGGGGGSDKYILSGVLTSGVNGMPVAGATLTLSGAASASTTSDGAGNYAFTGLGNGTYTVTPSFPATSTLAAAFDPGAYTGAISGGSRSGLDFTATRLAIVASGVPFLPASFLSSNQYRASLIVHGGYAYFTDSSAAPLKRAALDGSAVTGLASRFTPARKVVLSGPYAYWTDQASLYRAPTAGGAATLLATGSADHGGQITADLAVDATYAYWANTVAGSSPATYVIQAVPVAGGAAVTLATVTRPVNALAIDADHVYWEEAFEEPVAAGCDCGSTIKSVPKAGGASPALMVDNQLNGLKAPPPPGFTAGSWMPTGGIAVTGAELIFGVNTGPSYQIASVGLGGGTVTPLGTVPVSAGIGTGTILGPVVGGTDAYWLDSANQALDTIPLAGGSVTTLATGLGLPSGSGGLAVDGASVYWTEPLAPQGCCLRIGAGSIRQVPLTGGTVHTLVAGLDAPGALAVGSGSLVWADNWRVGTAGLDGSAVNTLASGIAGPMARIASDSANIYVLDGDYIKKVPLAGGTMTAVASANLGSIGDASQVGLDIATDGVAVYWTIGGVGGGLTVQKVPIAGGAPTTLASDSAWADPQGCCWRVWTDAQNVYWTAGGTSGPISGAVRAVPIAGGAVTSVVDLPYFANCTVDASDLYFSELAGGTIREVALAPLGGLAPATIQSGTSGWVMANDSARLYWITEEGAVKVLAKSAPAGTLAATLPGTLSVDPLTAFEALLADSGGIYLTETRTQTIYWAY